MSPVFSHLHFILLVQAVGPLAVLPVQSALCAFGEGQIYMAFSSFQQQIHASSSFPWFLAGRFKNLCIFPWYFFFIGVLIVMFRCFDVLFWWTLFITPRCSWFYSQWVPSLDADDLLSWRNIFQYGKQSPTTPKAAVFISGGSVSQRIVCFDWRISKEPICMLGPSIFLSMFDGSTLESFANMVCIEAAKRILTLHDIAHL